MKQGKSVRSPPPEEGVAKKKCDELTAITIFHPHCPTADDDGGKIRSEVVHRKKGGVRRKVF